MKKIIISDETRRELTRFVELSERFKNSYFWSPPTSARERRAMETNNYLHYKDDIIRIEVRFEVECSCRNVYVKKYISVDGVSKNITAIKNILKFDIKKERKEKLKKLSIFD